jgi:hypothetical protein
MVEYWLHPLHADTVEEGDLTGVPPSSVPKESYRCTHMNNVERFLTGNKQSVLYRALERSCSQVVSFYSSDEELKCFRTARRTSSRYPLYGKKCLCIVRWVVGLGITFTGIQYKRSYGLSRADQVTLWRHSRMKRKEMEELGGKLLRSCFFATKLLIVVSSGRHIAQ